MYARLRPFGRRVERTRRLIAQALARSGPWAVSFSGGKDSTVLLDLVREQAPDTPAVFVDSGAEFPETLAFVAATANVITVAPVMPLLEMYREVGDYGSQARSPDTHWGAGQLIEALIREPLTHANRTHGLEGNFTGLRAEEAVGRRALGRAHPGAWRAASGTWRCEPLMAWTARDVWGYLAQRGLAYNPVYDRLAALGVPRAEWRVAAYAGSTGLGRGRWAVLKQGWPELFNRFAAAFPEARCYS